MFKYFICFILLSGTSISQEIGPPENPKDTMISCPEIVIRALDKITARVQELSLKRGEMASFRTLRITVHHCLKNKPEDPPQTLAFLEITELKPNHALEPVFSGWMFASHPALSALEHPVYDVWIKEGLSPEDPKPLSLPPEAESSKVEPSFEESFDDPEASIEPPPEEKTPDPIGHLYEQLDDPSASQE
jgi:hypothetical protein